MSGRKPSLGRDIATEACRKFPNHGNMTLAKKIYKENPLVFTSLERTRAIIREIRGKAGKNRIKMTADKSLFTESKTRNAWEGFDSDAKEPIVFHLPKSIRRVLVLSDIHIPYQDNRALKAAFKYGRERGIDCVFINGDMLDFYQISDYGKDPRKRNLKGELEMGRKFFDILNQEFPDVVKYFIPGNHENRWEKYLFVKAPELLDISEFRLDVLLRCGEKKINFIPHGSDVYFGKLMVEHGDKLKGTGGVNPARTAMLKFKRSVLIGHFHKSSSANGVVYRGDNHMAWSTGHLGEDNPTYLPLNDWNKGFAIVEVSLDGNYKVENLQIIDGKCF